MAFFILHDKVDDDLEISSIHRPVVVFFRLLPKKNPFMLCSG
jgi:hypothetical protein